MNHLAAQVGRRGVQEILVDIGEHASRRTRVVVSSLEAFRIGAGIGGGEGREDGGEEVDDRGFLERKGGLGGDFGGEGVVPVTW